MGCFVTWVALLVVLERSLFMNLLDFAGPGREHGRDRGLRRLADARAAGLSHYLKGDRRTGWAAIGLSVMATQASAVTFLSMPGQGYQDGLGFVQNYFGAPLALILIAAVFLPMYRRLNVYTAYEYLGRRFDAKTRLLGAALFLLQRGLQAGITVYAPAIILSTVLHWRTDATILLTGLVVIVYTAAGGSQAVNVTQKYQLGVIFCGMLAAFVVLLRRMPAGVGLRRRPDPGRRLPQARRGRLLGRREPALHVLVGPAGGLLPRAVVLRHRPVAGPALPLGGVAPREPARADVQRRAQDPHAVLHPAAGDDGVRLLPVRAAAGLLQPGGVGERAEARPGRVGCGRWSGGTARSTPRSAGPSRPGSMRGTSGDRSAEAWARARALAAHDRSQAVRAEAKAALESLTPRAKSPDTDYVFITFILHHLPHGLIGLLIAAFFAATLSSKAAELNALASTTTVDFYRFLVKRQADDAHYVAASRWFTVMWGVVAVGFALFASLAENLIQAVNIVASIFYGVVLGAVPRRVLPAAGARDGRLLGGDRGAASGVRALRQPGASATSGTT